MIDEIEELSEVDMAMAEREAEEQAERERQAAESAKIRLAQALKKRKDKAVRHKSEIEQRWMQDERQYWGFRLGTEVDDEDGEDEECPPIDNKTQPKVDVAAARIGDMLFPTNDRNWSLTNTPEPTDIDGHPIDPKIAEEAAKAVERRIDDYLNESHYAKHGRSAIFDACKLGIGIIKGPFPKSSTKRVVRRSMEPLMDELGQPIMQLDEMGQPLIDEQGQPAMEMQSSMELQIIEETKPGACRVDPWMFFSLPCRSMDECEGVFELHLYPKQKLAGLAKHPGMDPDAIRRLLVTDPRLTDAENSLLTERQQLLRSESEPTNQYAVWEYHGPIDADLLKEMGYGVGEDPLDMYMGEVWFCADEVLKVELNAIMGDERVPYHVVPYKRDDADILNSWGIPRIMRDPQRSIDIVFEAMHYNTMLCSGPQVVMWEGRAVPADGKYTIRGPKTWKVTDEQVKSVKDIIQFENVDSVINQLIPMYELAKQNADENTALPAMIDGDASRVQQTLGEVSMIMNAQNIVQRRFAHAWDDEITIPCLTRFYWWEMEFGDDDEIKVEMEVDPRGASYLMVKDMQAQHAMLAIQMAGQDPELRARLKMDELYDVYFSFIDMPTDRLFKSDEEMQEEQANNPQAQMQQQAMQLELQEKEGQVRKINAEAMKAEADAQPQEQNDHRAELDYLREQMRHERENQDMQVRLIIAEMERDARLAQAAANQDIKLTELQAKLGIAEQDNQTKQMVERFRAEQAERDSQRREFAEGLKSAIQLRRKDLREERQDLMRRNVEAGHDTF